MTHPTCPECGHDAALHCTRCGRTWYGDEPLEMMLCDTERLVLKPGVVYRFMVAPGCDDCERIQADGRTAGDGTHAT